LPSAMSLALSMPSLCFSLCMQNCAQTLLCLLLVCCLPLTRVRDPKIEKMKKTTRRKTMGVDVCLCVDMQKQRHDERKVRRRKDALLCLLLAGCAFS
jgi:hypothetical protein